LSIYFEQAQPAALLEAYPIGAAFLEGPAALNAGQLRELQEKRFARVIERAWQVPFYKRHWREAGLNPGDIKTLNDLDKVPVFSKKDLMASVERSPPLGDYHGLAGQPHRAILHTTSGTTGAPQPLFFGPRDREIQNILLARAYLLQGLRPDDVVHSVYGLQVDLIHRFGATVLVGFSDFLRKLAAVAKEAGLEPGSDLKVRMICGHLDHASRVELSNLWGGADTFDWYGVGDTGIIAAEGPRQDGLYLWEDAHFVEMLDPKTAQPVADSTPGNICVTVLFKDTIYPIIRFDTQDLSTRLPPDPESGIGFRRITGFGGRSDNMVKLRGINVYPTAIGPLLQALNGFTGEYVCHVNEARDEMTVIAEYAGADTRAKNQLAQHLREKLGVRFAVELVAPGQTASLTGLEDRQKPQRLIDEPR
jgi:phenylacetate-CoA ligase